MLSGAPSSEPRGPSSRGWIAGSPELPPSDPLAPPRTLHGDQQRAGDGERHAGEPQLARRSPLPIPQRKGISALVAVIGATTLIVPMARAL